MCVVERGAAGDGVLAALASVLGAGVVVVLVLDAALQNDLDDVFHGDDTHNFVRRVTLVRSNAHQ